MNFSFLPHQRINHIPFMYPLTNKAALNTQTRSKYLLPTFTFPAKKKEFEAYLEKNPDKKLIEKNESNRGVRIITKDEVIFDKTEKVYQEFLCEWNKKF